MKKDVFPMWMLGIGQRGTVSELSDGGRHITDRLRDLGINEGDEVQCVMVSPLGDPQAYLIKGSVIALRREDSATVRVVAKSAEAIGSASVKKAKSTAEAGT